MKPFEGFTGDPTCGASGTPATCPIDTSSGHFAPIEAAERWSEVFFGFLESVEGDRGTKQGPLSAGPENTHTHTEEGDAPTHTH
jgi:hypothetical protein